MTLTRRTLLATTLAAPSIVRAQGSEPIRIGEINSYTAVPAFTVPYRNGWQLAIENVNAAGGVLGRKIEVISRDDAGRPTDAIRLAGELVNDQKVDLLAGAYLSNIGLALGDFASAEQEAFHRQRAADRRAGVGQGQSLHVPAATFHVYAGGDAGG